MYVSTCSSVRIYIHNMLSTAVSGAIRSWIEWYISHVDLEVIHLTLSCVDEVPVT